MVQARVIASCLRAAVAVVAFVAVSASAVAAHDFDPAHPPAGPNGGLVTAGDAGHVEFGIDAGKLIVWLTDHGGEPIASGNLVGHASFVTGAERLDLVLEPTGDHMMQAEDPRIAPVEGARVSFHTVLSDGMPLEARVIIPGEHAAAGEPAAHGH